MASSHTRRPRGEGALFETAAGTWRGYITAVDPRTGRPTRRWVSGKTRAAASRRLDAIRQGVEAGRHSTTETTGAYLDRWLPAMAPRLRARTYAEYASIVRRYIVPALGPIRLSRLVPSDVERMTSGLLADGLSALTARHARAVLRRALTDAQRDGLVMRNVAALAEPPRHEPREMLALDAASARALVAATADDRDGPLYALALATGLRQGELLGLAWADVDETARTMTVRRSLHRAIAGPPILGETKTPRSRRTLTLPALALDALAAQRSRQDADRTAARTAWQNADGLVFTDPVGRPLRSDGVSARFRIAADRAGYAGRFHDLRHSTASILLGAGVPLKVVSETLGHSGIGVTADVYVHLTRDSRSDAADALDRALGK